jgi:arylsulfatase A-like enzyme
MIDRFLRVFPIAGLGLALGLSLGHSSLIGSETGQSSEQTSSAPNKPNIIVIMADDLGYGDLSCYGATAVQTPNIDRLSREGLRFTSGYCSASTCTPTRYSLLTGTYAFRVKKTGVAPPNSPALIQPGTITMPSMLQQAGYATSVVGKWHLGLGAGSGPDWNHELKPGPLDIGFDHCLILPTTNDRVPQVYVQDRRVMNLDDKDPLWVGDEKPSPNHPTGQSHRHLLRMDWSHGHNQTIHNGIGRIGFYTGGMKARFRDEDLVDKWTTACQDWIRICSGKASLDKSKQSVGQEQDSKERSRQGAAAKPFFLFFASHDIHVPRMVHERFQGKTSLGPRGDAILEFDWSVGEILKTLDECDLAKNTLVLLTSDNGPVLDDGYHDEAIEKLGDHKPAGPFRGGKYNIYEGGTRTPFIARWPGTIQPGISDEVVCSIDLPSSLAALSGVSLPSDACLDSFNVLDALLGKPSAKGREHLLQQDNGTSGNFGFRVGNWKLQRHASGKSSNVELRLSTSKQPLLQLFDLSKDPAEKEDLSQQHPEIVKRLDEQLSKIIADGRTRTP